MNVQRRTICLQEPARFMRQRTVAGVLHLRCSPTETMMSLCLHRLNRWESSKLTMAATRSPTAGTMFFRGGLEHSKAARTLTTTGFRLLPKNVIVQFVKYGQSVACAGSPEVKVVGRGEAWILTKGHLIEAAGIDPPRSTSPNSEMLMGQR